MDKKTSDMLTNVAGIGVLAYGVTKIPFILKFLVACWIIVNIILPPIDWCYSAVMGERIFFTDAPPVFAPPLTEEERQQKWEKWYAEEDLFGSSPRDWRGSDKFTKAEAIYATSADQDDVFDCSVMGNMHACRKLRGKWTREEYKRNRD